MPNFPWPGRRDVSAISDTSLSALLAGAELPTGSPPELRPVAEALAALTAAPTGDELTGEAGLGRGEPRRAEPDLSTTPGPPCGHRLSARAAAAAVAALGIGARHRRSL
jgi:hypothetical protein